MEVSDDIDLMTLERIGIRNLFNTTNYEIELDTVNRITIIVGGNGTGKTTILNLLQAIGKANWKYLQRVPFSSFHLEFKEGDLVVKKDSEEESELHISWQEKKKKSQTTLRIPQHAYVYSEDEAGDRSFMKLVKGQTRLDEYQYNQYLRSIRHVGGRDNPLSAYSGVDLSKPEGIQAGVVFLTIMARITDAKPPRKIATTLIDVLRRMPYKLLSADRLVGKSEDKKAHVMECAEELKQKLSTISRNYSNTAMVLDAEFPEKMASWIRDNTTTTEKMKWTVSEAHIRLTDEIDELASLGLMQEEQIKKALRLSESDAKEMENIAAPAFAAHYDNLYKKLEVFSEIKKSLSLLIETVADFFGDKMRIKASYEHGLVAVPAPDVEIPLSLLSSGEQHVLILAYELVFDPVPEQLVLIDEPELSLHSSWQGRYVRVLRRIAEQEDRDLHFLLATHSYLIFKDGKTSAVELVRS